VPLMAFTGNKSKTRQGQKNRELFHRGE
jgi:hypothetical protein